MQRLWLATQGKVLELSRQDAGDASRAFDSVVPQPQQPKGGKQGRRTFRGTTKHPALLDEINDMVTRGLKAIEIERLRSREIAAVVRDGEVSSDRLAVYRSAFQLYVEDSSIYKSFLSSVLLEYDDCVDGLREQIRELSSVRLEIPLQQVDLAKQMRERDTEYSQRTDELLRRISQLEGALAASERKLTMVQKEFGEYKDSSDKMRSQWEEMRVSCMRLTSSLSRHDEDSKRNKAADTVRQAEFVAARVNEKKALEQSERLTLMLQEMEAVQSTLVTKEAVEEHLSTIAKLRGELKKKEDLHRDLINRYSTLKAALEGAYAANITTKGEILAAASRPGSDSKTTIEGISAPLSRENIRAAVEKLLDQIKDLKVSLAITESQIASDDMYKAQLDDANATSGQEFQSPWSHFEGLGMHASIPPYLRAAGKVQNFFMSRRDTAKLLKEIMSACEAAENRRLALEKEKQSIDPIPSSGSVKGVAEPFSTFFTSHLVERANGSSAKAVEIAYNLVDCLKKYSQESDCRLFALILDDALPAEVWFDLHKTLGSFLATLKSEEMRMLGGGAKAGGAAPSYTPRLSIEAFLRALKKVFPNKTEQAVSRISRGLVLETTSNRLVDVDRCLVEHDVSWSCVSEELRQQFINEIVEFTDSITDNVSKCREMPSDLTATVADLRNAIMQADPSKPRSEINEYLTRGCGVSLEQMLINEARRTEVNLVSFLNRLKAGLLKKGST